MFTFLDSTHLQPHLYSPHVPLLVLPGSAESIPKTITQNPKSALVSLIKLILQKLLKRCFYNRKKIRLKRPPLRLKASYMAYLFLACNYIFYINITNQTDLTNLVMFAFQFSKQMNPMLSYVLCFLRSVSALVLALICCPIVCTCFVSLLDSFCIVGSCVYICY